MRGVWFRGGLLALAVGLLSGCAPVLIGAGVAGGYAISKDSIKNTFDLPQSHVFRVSQDVINEVGLATVEDERRGLLKATVQGVNVTVTVKPLSKQTVELKVKARNNLLLPEIDVAQSVYNRIIERLH